ncbi:unnamed protein product [Withania somnifera]
MASDQNSLNKSISHDNRPTNIFSQARRKISFRRKKVLTVRLGAGGKRQRRRFSLVKIFRLKWLKLYYLRMLRKMKECYWSLVNDMLEGQETIDAFQRRLLFETSFAVPVMGWGLSFNTFPNHRGI